MKDKFLNDLTDILSEFVEEYIDISYDVNYTVFCVQLFPYSALSLATKHLFVWEMFCKHIIVSILCIFLISYIPIIFAAPKLYAKRSDILFLTYLSLSVQFL